MSLREENLAEFHRRFLAAARAQLSDEALLPRLHLDAQIALRDVSFDLLRWHEMLQPFGNDNVQPLFVSCGVEPSAPPRVFAERHLGLKLKQDNWQQRAIYFDSAVDPLPPSPWDVAYRLRSDFYQGEERIQLQVQALRSAAPLE